MSSLTQTSPRPVPVSHADRFGLTVFFALAVHAIVILGVSFNLSDDNPNNAMTTMEVTLVHTHSEKAPDKADYLAQANQLGGGDTRQKMRDASPFSNPAPTQEHGIAPDRERDLAAPPVPKKQTEAQLMTVDQAPRRVNSEARHVPLPVPKKPITAAQLFERSREIANLSAQIDAVRKAYSVTPRRTNVRGVQAKEYRFASYMDAWRIKVEKYGKLNYPEAASRRGINGSLILTVGIDKDGKIESVRIVKSSGHKILDTAAKHILRLAAPYPPLTKDIRKDTDVLMITRVWRFESGGFSAGGAK